MNSVQKVIKYLALAFAIFLSVSIIGGIITGLTGISYILSGRDSEAVGEMQVYPIDGEISSLSIDLSGAQLKIQTAVIRRVALHIRLLTRPLCRRDFVGRHHSGRRFWCSSHGSPSFVSLF